MDISLNKNNISQTDLLSESRLHEKKAEALIFDKRKKRNQVFPPAQNSFRLKKADFGTLGDDSAINKNMIETVKQNLKDKYVSSLLATKKFYIKKPWSEMTDVERKIRIRQLWLKVKMFVNLRKGIIEINRDIELREINEVFN